MFAPVFWKSRWPLFVLLGLAVAAAFGGALGHGFVNYDDPVLILNNPLIRTFSPKIWWSFDPQLYDPLTLFVYQILYFAFGFAPAAFHSASLIVHIANSVLLFLFLQRILSGRRVAFFGALLFAVHPLNTEAVVWASGLKNLLCTFFFMLSILCHNHPRKEFERLTPLFFFFALLAKVTAVTLPLVLLLLDAYKDGRVEKRHVVEKAFYFVVAGVFGTIAMFGRGEEVALLQPLQVLFLAAVSVFFYLQKFFFPVGLSAVYPAPALHLANPVVGASLLGIVSLIGFWIWSSRNRPAVAFGIGFFLITLMPSFLAYQKGGEVVLAADRYAYLPSIGLIVAVTGLLARLRIQKVALAVLSIATFIGIPLSWSQTKTWASTDSVFFNVARIYPTSTVALSYIGYVAMQRGDLDKAETFLRAALSRNENNARAWVNLSGTLVLRKRYAEAEEAARKATHYDPYNADSYLNLAWACLGQGKSNQASDAYHAAVRLAPRYAGAIPSLE